MDPFHNLLREAANSRTNGTSSASLPSTGSLTQGLTMGMPQALSSTGTSGLTLPMGMSLPLPMASLPGASTLAPIHRMNPLMAANSQLFPSLTATIPGLALASSTTTAPTSTASTPSSVTTSTVAKAADKTAKPAVSKKRKAPASTSSTASNADKDEAEEKEEYLDPKAKRRAQIAKAARKHRQRQKDELIALRAKVKDLKEQIEVLQSSEPSEHNTELGWKQEAEQHAEIRARVDQENEFLRKTLMEQMKFIQRLQDYFAKQPLLNMPSLDMILSSSSTPTPTPAALSNTITSSVSANTLQLPTSSFQEQLRRLANDAMATADKALSDCETAFRSPKNPTMTYFGLEVQYEMSKSEMGIFFRHHIYNCDATVVCDDLWECVGNASFEKKFPFMESVEVLEELDAHTKYVRRVVNLTIGSDAGQPNSTIKEESLVVNQKRENPDGSIYYISRSVKHDPSHPKPADHIRRNQTTTVSLRNFTDANGTGCVLLWSVKVLVDKDSEDRNKPANIPDIILKNLFEITPVYVKAVVDRARGVVGHN
ncbi:hypothetical protein PINS_up007301 [Pythium insidiosum]|nr:hypothetical protein PINS_up007301 [Pythium insidiosum]